MSKSSRDGYINLSVYATSRMALGVKCDQSEDFEKANEYYTECIQLLVELDNKKDASDKNTMALAYMNRASNHYTLGRIDEAMPDYNRAINILLDMRNKKELEDDFDLFMAYKNRSHAYIVDDDLTSAADDTISALRELKGVFSFRFELQELYYVVLKELIVLLDYEDSDEKKQNVLDEFLYAMRQVPKRTEAEIAQNRLLLELA